MKLLLVALLAAPLPAAAAPLAIIHAKAWTMTTAEAVPDATILIDGGRIVSVTRNGPVPAEATIIDAAGLPVTPGLVNGAAQLGLMEVSSATATNDLTSASEAFGASFDVSPALNGNSTLVALARADGVTGALSFPSKSAVAPFSGQAALVRLRGGSEILDRARAALFVTIGGGAWDKVGSRAAQWQLLRAMFGEARVPLDPGDPDALLNRRDAATLRQVVAGAMPLAIQTNRESDIRQAIRFATEQKVRVVIVGGAEAWRAAEALAAAHIAVVLDPEANLPGSFDQLGARLDNAALLARAGVTVAFGLSGGPIEETYNAGLDLREGAGLAVANGLPYRDGLKAITTNPRLIWGAAPGTLTPGAAADLVVWDGDPLEPSTNARSVIIDGKVESLMTRQHELEMRYKAQ